MKKHNAIKVVLFVTMAFVVLSWLIPAAYFQTEFVQQERVQMGLFDLFNYPMTALSYFGHVALYILAVGGFYGILYKIPAYRTLLDSIVKKVEKSKMLFLSIVMAIIAVLTSVCGLQLGLMLLFPFVVSIVLLMGYDKIVAALTTVGATVVGLAGTTYATSNVSVLNQSLGLDISDNISIKFAILVVGLALLIFNTVEYTKRNGVKNKALDITEIKTAAEEVIEEVEEKVEEVVEEVKEEVTEKVEEVKEKVQPKKTTQGAKSSKKKSNKKGKSKNKNKASLKEDAIIVVKKALEDTEDGLFPKAVAAAKNLIPMIVLMCALLVVLVIAFIPWKEAFGIDAMTKATEAVQGYEIFGFALFAKLLGTFNEFGTWMVTDMMLPMALVALLLVVIYKVKLADAFDGMVEGIKKAAAPAFVAVLVYTILVISTYHPFQATIYHFIMGSAKHFGVLEVIKTTLIATLSSLFNGDMLYTMQASAPYVASLVKDDFYPVVEIIYQSVYGCAMLCAPTSLILMSVLSYLDVKYIDWLKAIWKLIVEFIAVLVIIFLILLFI